MKFSEIIRIVNPEYVYIRLKPNNAIRNNNTHLIARSIAGLYRRIWEGIKKDEEKLIRLLGKEILIGTKWSFHRQTKVAYYVYIERKKVEFYFIVPRQYLSVIREKIGDVWTNLTIDQVNEIPIFSDKSTKRQLVYEREDGMSLRTDRRDNDLLANNLNIIDVLEEGDKVGILYNFIPSSQGSFRHSYAATMQKVKKGMPVERNKAGAAYLLKMTAALLDGLVRSITETIAGKKATTQEVSLLDGIIDRLNGDRKVKESTERKANAAILKTQILVMSKSADSLRQRNHATSLAQSFDAISDDNRLISKEFRGKINFHARQIDGAEINRISDLEAQNFIGLAGRELLERFPSIEKVETQETEVPEDLRQGVMCIGESTCRGHKQLAYLSNDREYRNLLLLLIGPTRAGKSNLIANLSVDAIEARECVILFDFIENCELSDSIASLFPKDKLLEIRCDDPAKMQGLGYNEVGYSKDTFQQYENAKLQTANVLALINSIHADESRLSPKMERYLESASLIVFISGGSIKDVFSVLQNHKARAAYLSKVPKLQYENLEEYMESLRELDDYDRKSAEIVGTNLNLITGIIDRLNTLKRNSYMEMTLKKDTVGNVNLVDEFQKAQLITIKMPQRMFTTAGEKDIYTTYWMTKIWLALQVRADRIRDKSKRVKVNLVIDEIYQVENTEKFLTAQLSQVAKFICKPIISCHYINQIKHMRDELRSANASYMLISGCDKKNFDELKNELYPYTDEDLRNLPRYHSLNYIKCEGGYAQFITQLPGVVEKRVRKTLAPV